MNRLWAWVMVALLTLGVGSVQAQCDVNRVGNAVSDHLAARSAVDVRQAIRPILNKFNMGCLMQSINLGGLGRLGNFNAGRLIQAWMQGLADRACRVVLNEITLNDPPVPIVLPLMDDRDVMWVSIVSVGGVG